MRSFLTMLGIIIGIASVISVVALGTGTQKQVLENISSLAPTRSKSFPAAALAMSGRTRSRRLWWAMRTLRSLSYVAGVTPTVSTSTTARFGSTEANALVNGVGRDYFEVKGSKLVDGRLFDESSVATLSQDAVIDENTSKALFGQSGINPIGQVILAGSVPCRVIGVIASQQGGFGSNDNLSIYLPYTSVQTRFIGSTSLRSVTVRVSDNVDSQLAKPQ